MAQALGAGLDACPSDLGPELAALDLIPVATVVEHTPEVAHTH